MTPAIHHTVLAVRDLEQSLRFYRDGIGRVLLDAFLKAAEGAEVWTVQSGVFPENEPSLALHRELGFRTVGTRERVGKMGYGPYAGTWRDVVMIERRSPQVGID